MSDKSDEISNSVAKAIIQMLKDKKIDPEAALVAYMCHMSEQELAKMSNETLLRACNILAGNLVLLEIASRTGIVLGEPVTTQKHLDDLNETIGRIDSAMEKINNVLVSRSSDFPDRIQKS